MKPYAAILSGDLLCLGAAFATLPAGAEEGAAPVPAGRPLLGNHLN